MIQAFEAGLPLARDRDGDGEIGQVQAVLRARQHQVHDAGITPPGPDGEWRGAGEAGGPVLPEAGDAGLAQIAALLAGGAFDHERRGPAAVPAMGVDDLGSGMAGDRRVMADDLLAQMARGQGRSETVAPAEYRSSANAAYDAQNGVAAAVPQVVFETQVRPMNGIASGDVMRSSDMPRFEAGPVVVGPVPRSGLLGDGPAMPSGTIAGPTVGAEALHAVLLMAAAASGTDGPAMGAQASVAASPGHPPMLPGFLAQGAGAGGPAQGWPRDEREVRLPADLPVVSGAGAPVSVPGLMGSAAMRDPSSRGADDVIGMRPPADAEPPLGVMGDADGEHRGEPAANGLHEVNQQQFQVHTEVHLDGHVIAQAVTERMVAALNGPLAGTGGFDARRSYSPVEG